MFGLQRKPQFSILDPNSHGLNGCSYQSVCGVKVYFRLNHS